MMQMKIEKFQRNMKKFGVKKLIEGINGGEKIQ